MSRFGVAFASTLSVLSAVTVGFAQPVEWPIADGGNGHFYEAVAVPGDIVWTDAQAAAVAAGGYLATITSPEENAFVFSLTVTRAEVWFHPNNSLGPWIGGWQDPNDPGYSEPAGGWKWVTGEVWGYTAWHSGEPNNVWGDDRLHYFGHSGMEPRWNDAPDDAGHYGGLRGYVVEYLPCPSAIPDARCASGQGAASRSEPFPPCGLDDFATGASFKVVMLDGSEAGVGVWVDSGGGAHGSPAVDANTIIGRSDPFFESDPEDDGIVICGGGQPPYADTAAIAGDPCVFPAGFPEDSTGGHEIHTEILSLNLVDPDGNTVKAGQPFYDSVVGTPQERFYQNSFGEVQGLDNDFPADSFFNVFVEVYVAALDQRFYNKTPMVLRAEITHFPPDLSLPRSVYLHDPSFGATPLFDEDGLHVAYLLSSGHGAVDIQPPPLECDVPTLLSSPVSFSVDSQSEGLEPGVTGLPPNHVFDDSGLPDQQVTAYLSSGGNPGSSPDITNARIDRLAGDLTPPAPPAFAPGDAINSFSYGRDGSRDTEGEQTFGTLLFSVDRGSLGESCTSVRLGSESAVPEQAADIYMTGGGAFGGYAGPFVPKADAFANSLLADQTVLGLRPPLQETGQDNLTGLEVSAFALSDRFYGTFMGGSFDCGNGDCATVFVYDEQGDAGANPFRPNNLQVFSQAGDVGLQVSDLIDAVVVSDLTSVGGHPTPNGLMDSGLDEILFSLSPSSPSLFGPDGGPGVAGVDDDGENGVDDFGETGMGDDLSPAQIFYSSFDGSFSTFASSSAMGLLATDNVDALDIGPTLTIEDCNCNDIEDACDISRDFSNDCNTNAIPDECERAGNDCNCNDVPDRTCDVDPTDPDGDGLVSADCNGNFLPDECEPDCDGDLIPDKCEIADCLPDDPSCQDCNGNDIPDECDITLGTLPDTNTDAIPDPCGACCGALGCEQMTADLCDSTGYGKYRGDMTTCEQEACAGIPTISHWGLITLSLLMLTAGTLVYRYRSLGPRPA